MARRGHDGSAGPAQVPASDSGFRFKVQVQVQQPNSQTVKPPKWPFKLIPIAPLPHCWQDGSGYREWCSTGEQGVK